mmetsp:Transcript_16696/g.27705  ORF Transcript_16696/g.27705 Transcript_16696/m.27705 type:complete len:191 (-) Transcript_16696:524-1096(-)|eukprot:CAMPEP_0119023184 /NCGR_PEP_ID=MMETSP1176-20130426/29493_1 /TAXON_ID=265551 /ORGANISM="Synedropsis recta cf, Strain CCMP1620" /LENGTH=190 /DNA_ID=CAMNT_0006978207 /DNA_START=393 /DNA_END=965 /DNA_ORIENTATION=-
MDTVVEAALCVHGSDDSVMKITDYSTGLYYHDAPVIQIKSSVGQFLTTLLAMPLPRIANAIKEAASNPNRNKREASPADCFLEEEPPPEVEAAYSRERANSIDKSVRLAVTSATMDAWLIQNKAVRSVYVQLTRNTDDNYVAAHCFLRALKTRNAVSLLPVVVVDECDKPIRDVLPDLMGGNENVSEGTL